MQFTTSPSLTFPVTRRFFKMRERVLWPGEKHSPQSTGPRSLQSAGFRGTVFEQSNPQGYWRDSCQWRTQNFILGRGGGGRDRLRATRWYTLSRSVFQALDTPPFLLPFFSFYLRGGGGAVRAPLTPAMEKGGKREVRGWVPYRWRAADCWRWRLLSGYRGHCRSPGRASATSSRVDSSR